MPTLLIGWKRGVLWALTLLLQLTAAHAVTLAWDPNTEPDISGYRLYYGTEPGTYSAFIDAGLDTTTDIDDLQPGTTYYFVVTARNAAGLESTPSNEVSLIIPPDPFADDDADGLPNSWEISQGLNPADETENNGALGDPDADGIPNLLEYAFALPPMTAGRTGLPVPEIILNQTGGQQHLYLTFRRRVGETGLTYTIQSSSDLHQWEPATHEITQVTPVDDEVELVKVRIDPPLEAGSPVRIVRVAVSNPPPSLREGNEQ